MLDIEILQVVHCETTGMKSECGRDPCLCTSSAPAVFVALDICLGTILQTSKKKVSNRFYGVPNILLYAVSQFIRIEENSGGFEVDWIWRI
jgi:hypothetical protein